MVSNSAEGASSARYPYLFLAGLDGCPDDQTRDGDPLRWHTYAMVLPRLAASEEMRGTGDPFHPLVSAMLASGFPKLQEWKHSKRYGLRFIRAFSAAIEVSPIDIIAASIQEGDAHAFMLSLLDSFDLLEKAVFVAPKHWSIGPFIRNGCGNRPIVNAEIGAS